MNARVALKIRVLEHGPAHVRIAVFTGRNVGALGLSGHLVIRTEDWPTIRARLGGMADANLLVLLEGVSDREQLADEVEAWIGRHDAEHPIQVIGCGPCAAREDERRARAGG